MALNPWGEIIAEAQLTEDLLIANLTAAVLKEKREDTLQFFDRYRRPELYGGLPADPQIPFSYTYWKWIAKPIGLLIALMALLAVIFHYIFTGPKLPQPESREEDV